MIRRVKSGSREPNPGFASYAGFRPSGFDPSHDPNDGSERASSVPRLQGRLLAGYFFLLRPERRNQSSGQARNTNLMPMTSDGTRGNDPAHEATDTCRHEESARKARCRPSYLLPQAVLPH